MSFLYIFLGQSFELCLLDESPAQVFERNSITYELQTQPNDCVFYDWLVEEGGSPCALEVFLFKGDRDQINFAGWPNPHTTFDDFPTIWLKGFKPAGPLGLQAFGDIEFYKGQLDQWCVVVGLDLWLTPKQSEDLRGLVNERNKTPC